VPDFAKFIGDDARTTYEHVGQLLAQINGIGITTCIKLGYLPYPYPVPLSIGSHPWHLTQ
jgi:hypothetical protein